MTMLAVALALALVIGLLLGLLGGGGSILTVPVLVYLLGYGAKTAIAMSLPVVGITSLVGAGLHWRLGNVRGRVAGLFGLFAMVGAFAGAKLAVLLSGSVQLALLGGVMLVAAAAMLRGPRDTDDARVDADARARPGVRSAAPGARFLLIVPVALLVGLLTGIVGIGGGFLVVPALVLLARVPMRQAVGTSLLVISMNAAAGFLGYLGTVAIEWLFLASFTTAAIAGALLGATWTRRIPQPLLTRAFAMLLLVAGGFVLFMN